MDKPARVVIFPATHEDVLKVSESLREEDKQEVETASGRPAVEAVLHGWRSSKYSFTAHVDGTPAIVFGVAFDGVIWMLCTDAIKKAPLAVFKLSQRVITLFKGLGFKRLYNVADCRNKLHIGWLERLGFTMGQVVNVNGHPFQFFQMETSPCVT